MKINNPLFTLYNSKPVKGVINWAVKDSAKNYKFLQENVPYAMVILSLTAQGIFLAKSDDIPKERKIPLVLNNVFTGIIGLSGGFLLKKHVRKVSEVLRKRAEGLYIETEKNPAILLDGIKSAVPFLTTTMLFSYFGHVIATPLSTQATAFLAKRGLIDLSDKNKKSTQFNA